MNKENEYIGINDGYGVVGYGFYCQHCGTWNMFVDEEESEQVCKNCSGKTKMKPYQYGVNK